MLAGLKIEGGKKGKEKKDDKKQKKVKKEKKSKAEKSESSGSPAPQRSGGPAAEGPGDRAEVDFFGSLGVERSKEAKLKPDPDKPAVSEREYNPFLRGELSNLPTPKSAGSVPSAVCVGDGGAGWRARAQKRAQQAAREAAKAGDQAPAAGRGQQGGGERQAEADGRRARDRSASRSPQRKRPRSRSRSASPLQRKGLPGRAAPERRGSGEADKVMERMQAKYGGGGSAAAAAPEPTAAAPAAPAATPAAPAAAADSEDANVLGAQAMEAMLSGDMARYEELNKRLEAVQAKMNSKETEGAAGKPERAAQRVKVVEEVDAAGRSRALVESVQTTSTGTKGRNKRGMANAVPGKGANFTGFYEDDNVSLDELVRRERIAGQQDYNGNLEKHILKKGNKFKMLDEDEDEAYALGWFEDKSKKMDQNRRNERNRRQDRSDKDRMQVNLQNCTRCMDSAKFFRREAVISVAQHSYLCVEGFHQCILPGQVFISPLEHLPAITEVDEEVYQEIRNFQKCLVRFYEQEEPPRAVIFVESAVHRVSRDKALMGAGPHAAIIAYPIELELLQEARLYWKKAFDEAENEFTVQHKKVIPTDAKGGVRKAVPKGFPYLHVDFSLGGGFAHVVDDVQEFPKDFAQQTMAGMCQLTVLDRAYKSREHYKVACSEIKNRFCKGGFDWAAALRS